jgi:hypothetical protein
MEMRKLSVSLILLFCLILAAPFDSHASFFNWGSCLRWRITGICRIVCSPGGCQVWVRVRHWRPDEVSETVNIPGASRWGESFPGVMASLFGAIGGFGPFTGRDRSFRYGWRWLSSSPFLQGGVVKEEEQLSKPPSPIRFGTMTSEIRALTHSHP